MATKSKYKKILERKKVLLNDAPGQPSKLINYQYAMQLAQSNLGSGDLGVYARGIYYLEQITGQVEDAPEPTIYLLKVYLDQMRLEKAQALADFLRDKFPVNSSALRERAAFHLAMGDAPEAEHILKRAIEIYPNSYKNVCALADTYIVMGDKRRAIECFERALHIKPDHYGALFGKSRIVGESATDAFISQIKSVIASNKFNGVQLGELHFALALIFAETDIDQHFYHLNEANRAVAATRVFEFAALKKEAAVIMDRFNRSLLDSFQGLVSDDSKPIFIVGMPRSGTTLLEQIIGAHAQCQPIGESHAFTNAVASADKSIQVSLDAETTQAIEQWRQYLNHVADQFKNSHWVAKAGNHSPVSKTIGNHRYVGLILSALPNARVINLERHPLAVIYSCYQENFSSGNTFSFNLEWAAEYYKIHKSLMSHWKAIFPEKILTIYYENLVRDKESEIARILEFCDLPWDPACLEHQNSVSSVRTASDIQVRQPVYQSSIERWKKVEPYLEPAKQLLGEWLDYPE